MQDCHIGNYMEGYLTHRNDGWNIVSIRSNETLVAAFCFTCGWSITSDSKKIRKGWYYEFRPNYYSNGDAI